MLVKYWKNFKWFLFIPLILFVFFLNIKNVNAYVYKGEVWNTMDKYNVSGSLNNNSSTTLSFNINNSNINSTSVPYDLIVFKFNNFYLTYENEIENTWCYEWLPEGNGYVCRQVQGNQGFNNGLSTLNGGNFYMQATSYWGTNGDTLACFMSSDLQDQIICPIKRTTTTNLTKLEIIIQNGGNYKLSYNFQLSGLKYYYNYESSEFTIQQQTTNTNLQYIYTQQQQQGQYMQNDSTTGATTQMTGDFSDLATSFNSELQGVNDLSQLVLLPISLFMDLSTDNCQPLHLVVPFVNTSVDLPCMKAIFNTFFSGFYSIFTTIMSAVICYWVAVKTGALIKEIVDCDNDRIEVVDL